MKYKDCNGDVIREGDRLVHATYPSTIWTVVKVPEGFMISGRNGSFQLYPSSRMDKKYNLTSTNYRIKR